MSVQNITLRFLISLAYEVDEYRVTGGPGWIDDMRYHVVARPAAPASESDARLMLQALLAERFRLQVHGETRVSEGYSLLAPKGSARLRKSASGKEEGFQIMTGAQMQGTGIPIAMLARALTTLLGKSVDDRTGLTGVYDVAMNWMPDDAAPDARSLFTALKEDLGLSLKPTKVQLKTIVIDHAEKVPVDN